MAKARLPSTFILPPMNRVVGLAWPLMRLTKSSVVKPKVRSGAGVTPGVTVIWSLAKARNQSPPLLPLRLTWILAFRPAAFSGIKALGSLLKIS